MPHICYKIFYFFVIALLLTEPFVVHTKDCEKIKLIDFPKNDLPEIVDTSLRNQEELKVNGSYKFYYGIGVPVDYVRARHLAFTEMTLNTEDESDPFTGASILMLPYANGFGVNQDLDISTRLACANVGFAEAEIEGRIEHLKKLKSGELKGVFDLCDDITSGYMMGFCSGVHSELNNIRRQAMIDSVIKGWPEKEKKEYASLRKVASDFFEKKVMSEVDMSGTARAAEEIGEKESLEDDFKEKIITANKCAFNPGDCHQAGNPINSKGLDQI